MSDTERVSAALAHRSFAKTLSTVRRRLKTAAPEKRVSPTVVGAMASAARSSAPAPDRLKAGTNPTLVLQAAQSRYGIDPAEYGIGSGNDGTPRILHKGKQYNLGDFFTKHLKRPWAEAEPILRDCYHASLSDALPPPDKVLWRQFNDWRNRQITDQAAKRAEQSAEFRMRILEARERYREHKASAQRLSKVARTAAVARARADQFLTQQGIATERAQANEQGRIPRRNAHYREFLTQLAGHGDTKALDELRRMAPHQHEDLEPKVSGERSRAVFPLPTYTVDAAGAVTYRSTAGAIVKDSVQGVSVLKADAQAYDAAVRVAIARYGRSLTLQGDAKFVSRMTEAAKRTGLEITIRDASRPRAPLIVVRSKGRAAPDR